ncbi:hypothetical protein TVAG_130290 [Trichomonas vaginalis G3]|uniref:Uncharacterized protein n=1 Tax=Trichomonas vaginalis (strain ATCC PRA-98 / G3) TaxID=412133 RepID=A2DIC5_TRIV3|nr:hypothetical protein TVAGG3_0711640 [Trichomonas vaginalis G3]EAY19921.1 hypothetical protein TVAG_130290 [Trichomonas vaginalis G3]KAI5509944.1 hypothetical protein TVAGG3_0711640 [Trichomonas vaginalis G3]|eukprot:XP_001580907.1 hypothetical protein [Trichomonas vaginalis G3]
MSSQLALVSRQQTTDSTNASSPTSQSHRKHKLTSRSKRDLFSPLASTKAKAPSAQKTFCSKMSLSGTFQRILHKFFLLSKLTKKVSSLSKLLILKQNMPRQSTSTTIPGSMMKGFRRLLEAIRLNLLMYPQIVRCFSTNAIFIHK